MADEERCLRFSPAEQNGTVAPKGKHSTVEPVRTQAGWSREGCRGEVSCAFFKTVVAVIPWREGNGWGFRSATRRGWKKRTTPAPNAARLPCCERLPIWPITSGAEVGAGNRLWTGQPAPSARGATLWAWSIPSHASHASSTTSVMGCACTTDSWWCSVARLRPAARIGIIQLTLGFPAGFPSFHP